MLLIVQNIIKCSPTSISEISVLATSTSGDFKFYTLKFYFNGSRKHSIIKMPEFVSSKVFINKIKLDLI